MYNDGLEKIYLHLYAKDATGFENVYSLTFNYDDTCDWFAETKANGFLDMHDWKFVYKGTNHNNYQQFTFVERD